MMMDGQRFCSLIYSKKYTSNTLSEIQPTAFGNLNSPCDIVNCWFQLLHVIDDNPLPEYLSKKKINAC
jgi:hypothetical protein